MDAHRSMRAADDLPKEMQAIRRPSRNGHAGSEHPSAGKSLEVIILSTIATDLSKLKCLLLGSVSGRLLAAGQALWTPTWSMGDRSRRAGLVLGSAIATAPVEVGLDRDT